MEEIKKLNDEFNLIKEKKEEIKKLHEDFFQNTTPTNLTLTSFLNNLLIKKILCFLNEKDNLFNQQQIENFLKAYQKDIAKEDNIGYKMEIFKEHVNEYTNSQFINLTILEKTIKKKSKYSIFKNIPEDILNILLKLFTKEIHQEILLMTKNYKFTNDKKTEVDKKFFLYSNNNDIEIKKNVEELKLILSDFLKKKIISESSNIQKYISIFIDSKIKMILKEIEQIQRSEIFDKINKATKEVVKKNIKRVIVRKENPKIKKSKKGKFLKKDEIESIEEDIFEFKKSI
jgi:hypothetical protein